MSYFLLSFLFWLAFIDEEISYFIKTSIDNYIGSFDCIYFRYWEISHDEEFIEMYLNSDLYETYFKPLTSEEEAIEILKKEVAPLLPENIDINSLTTNEMLYYFRDYLEKATKSINK